MLAARTEELAALNRNSFKGLFPVQIAAKYNNARIVRMLVEAGANPGSMSQAGIPTLLFALGFYCIDGGNLDGVEVTKCLVEELHVNVNAQYISPTWQQPNRNSIFDILINHRTITTLMSALMCAVLYSSPEMVALLLKHGADKTLTDARARPPCIIVSTIRPLPSGALDHRFCWRRRHRTTDQPFRPFCQSCRRKQQWLSSAEYLASVSFPRPWFSQHTCGT